MKFILFDEGRLVPKTGGSDYEYFIKDHLGNTRLTLQDSSGHAAIKQENQYYPLRQAQCSVFGMVLGGQSYQASTGYIKNDYLYNGKEFQDELGLDWYDYGARFYDPQIGRWHTVDPLAEKAYSWTPYRYAFNNPIIFLDPNGLLEDDYYTLIGNEVRYLGSDGKGNNIKISAMSDKEANSVSKGLKGEKTTSEKEQQMKSDNRFLLLQIQSQESQAKFIEGMKKESSTGEIGAYMKLKVISGKAAFLRFAGKFSGTDGVGGKQVDFSFDRDDNGDITCAHNGVTVIGTAHTHLDDEGLSGSYNRGSDEDNKSFTGAGDVYNVNTTGIPFFTIGPTKNHVGYKDNYNRIQTPEYTGKNMLFDALKYITGQ